MEFRLKKFLKQTGVAMTEYAILLAFVAAIGASFTSDSGLSSSISGAVSKVVSVFGYFGGYKEVAAGNQPHFTGKGSGTLSGIDFGKHTSDQWSWEQVYTNDSGQEAGSAFLDDGGKSGIASGYAKKLLDQMYAAGSFGGVDPMSWAFTEGCGTNTQSLNLYWSNSDWKNIDNGTVPIIQMNKEAGKDTAQYYVAMANVKDGKLQLWNQAAALKGEVSYVNASNGEMVNMTCDATGSAPANGTNVNTASQKLDSSLAFSNYNDAQKAYYDLVSKHNIQTQNNYKP